MKEATPRAAVTLAEASMRLGVTRQRVSQLLAEGQLEGPSYDGARAPANADRVWTSSLEAFRRQPPGPRRSRVTAAELELRVGRLEREIAELRRGASGRSPDGDVRAARQAAQQFKVLAETIRITLEEERQENRAMREELDRLRRANEAATSELQLERTMRRTFSDGLTSLLGPDSPFEAL